MQAHVGTIVCKFGGDPVMFVVEVQAIFVKSERCPYHVTFDLDLDLKSTPWMQARVVTMLCKFGGDPVKFVAEEAIFVQSDKCPYHVTFHLDLDLEHILDVCPCGGHRVQVWCRSSHVCGRSSDLLIKVYRRTDGQTDRRTTDASRLHKLME